MKPAFSLQIIFVYYGFIFISVILLTVIALYLNLAEIIATEQLSGNMIFITIILILSIGHLVLATLVFNHRLKIAQKKELLEEKLRSYMVSAVLQFAFLEAGVILALAGYILTNSVVMFAVVAVSVIYLFWNRPSRNKIMRDLELDQFYREEIENFSLTG